MHQPPLTPLGNGPPSAENAEAIATFGDRSRRGAARIAAVCYLLDAAPETVTSLRSAPDPYERLAGALIEVSCAIRREDIAPPGGWGPGEANATAGLIAELWGEHDAEGAVFAAHHTLVLTKAARADIDVLEAVITAADLAVPARQRGWPNGELLRRLDTTLRAPLRDNAMASLEARHAVLSGWVSLGGGNRLLTKLLDLGPSERSLAVCCYALFSEAPGVSSDDAQQGGRDVLRLLGAGHITEALAAAHRITGIPVT